MHILSPVTRKMNRMKSYPAAANILSDTNATERKGSIFVYIVIWFLSRADLQLTVESWASGRMLRVLV